ncbi:hypothetical protein POV27_05770 [Aureisphaera galaxeae]|uniref:hypothetical protein n=1 Tax=Aureisphaera galaxeae TaxID=1538023 RepID=UPI0023505D56|nr:hypothetical protein [Aureisphaera galaxeae]MDC8003549.1 hypothetical protein [Aureisphaera galaxeae]
MKKLLLITVALLSINAFGQGKYEKGMMKAFDLWKNGKSSEASNLFERIAQAEQDNWLPPFYVAQVNIFNSFNEKDEEVLTAQLKKAQDFLNDAKAISKDNPEILVAQAQLYTAWVAFDGQRFGMTYAPKIAQLYEEAYKLEPGNPRVAFGKVEWDLGTARFFGQDTSTFCEDLASAVALFETYEPKGEFHPRGGGDYAKQSLEQNCKKE